MIERYSLPEMAAVFAEQRKLEVWKEVEALTLEAWAAAGVAPDPAPAMLRRAPVPTPEAVAEREEITNHDLAAFVDLLGAGMAAHGEWVHYGLTSSDVLDTANAVVLNEAAGLLLARLSHLFGEVKRRAFEHRDTVMVGRTHGMWAEPTTFGLKLAQAYAE
ncbi:MAG TPA: lyase family protein, partial [Acidimicrobiia bacterium]